MEPIILVIKGGTLRIAEKEEFKRKNGEDIDIRHYTLDTVDKMYKVVDLDKSEVKPIIRSILGQIGLYPELGIVKSSRYMIGGLILISVISLFSISGKMQEKTYIEGQKTIVDTIKKSCSTKLPSIDTKALDKEKPEESNFKIFGK